MSGARWRTAASSDVPMPPSHPIALRKEAAGVAREAQAERVRNGAPARCVLFELHGRCRASARERGCSRASGKDLGGERSPGRIGRPPAGNGRMASRNSTAEQSLEADAPIKRISKGRLWQRSRSEEASGTGGNGKGATATVTWCGCGRVEFFEGCEKRREDCESTKRGEPHDWQRDATSPRPFERRKPSRWCETTRTERDSEAGSLGTEPGRQQCRFGGVDAREGCRWRGVTTPDFARQRGPQGQQSQLTARVVSAKLGLSRRIPREEVGKSDQGDR
jgi:hypothetical protein